MNKVNSIIEIIRTMSFINKVRFGVCAFSSKSLNFMYDKKYYYNQYNNLLKKYDEEYVNDILDLRRHQIIIFVLARMMEMSDEEKNQIMLWFVNNI